MSWILINKWLLIDHKEWASWLCLLLWFVGFPVEQLRKLLSVRPEWWTFRPSRVVLDQEQSIQTCVLLWWKVMGWLPQPCSDSLIHMNTSSICCKSPARALFLCQHVFNSLCWLTASDCFWKLWQGAVAAMWTDNPEGVDTGRILATKCCR